MEGLRGSAISHWIAVKEGSGSFIMGSCTDGGAMKIRVAGKDLSMLSMALFKDSYASTMNSASMNSAS